MVTLSQPLSPTLRPSHKATSQAGGTSPIQHFSDGLPNNDEQPSQEEVQWSQEDTPPADWDKPLPDHIIPEFSDSDDDSASFHKALHKDRTFLHEGEKELVEIDRMILKAIEPFAPEAMNFRKENHPLLKVSEYQVPHNTFSESNARNISRSGKYCDEEISQIWTLITIRDPHERWNVEIPDAERKVARLITAFARQFAFFAKRDPVANRMIRHAYSSLKFVARLSRHFPVESRMAIALEADAKYLPLNLRKEITGDRKDEVLVNYVRMGQPAQSAPVPRQSLYTIPDIPTWQDFKPHLRNRDQTIGYITTIRTLSIGLAC